MIHINNLFFSYTGSSPYVIDDITLHIKAGEYVSILGENGCGKSTLIRLLLGLLKPTRGSITTNATRIGYVPQKKDYSNSSFPITVSEALHSYRRILKLKDKTIIEKNLQMVGMSDYLDEMMENLSGGQSQKILIARALMGNPDLLVLDEPSTGVDIKSQIEIYDFLKNLSTQKGITIITVEHNLEAALSNSSVIYHMQNGKGHLCNPKQYISEYLKNTGRENNQNASI